MIKSAADAGLPRFSYIRRPLTWVVFVVYAAQVACSAALGVSVAELLRGMDIENRNRAGNMGHLHFYVCPVCGNMLHALGEAALVTADRCTLVKLYPEGTAQLRFPLGSTLYWCCNRHGLYFRKL